MANEPKPAGSAVPRTAMDAADQVGRAATEAGSRVGGAAAQAGTDFSRTMADSTAMMGNAMGGEFMKLFSEMKLPAMPDMQALMEAHRRNLETLSAANRVALEGAQAVARRHMEIMQQTMSELTEGMRQLSSPDAPQAKAAQQAEMLKRAYEQAVNNMRELRDLIQHSNGEALELLNRRFATAMDEVKTLIEKGQAQARPV